VTRRFLRPDTYALLTLCLVFLAFFDLGNGGVFQWFLAAVSWFCVGMMAHAEEAT